MKFIVSGAHVWGCEFSDNAVLIEDGEIKSIGLIDELKQQDTKVHHYPKALITPGFTDAHLHLHWLGETLLMCDLRGCTTSLEFLARLQQYVLKLPEGDVLQGFGWDDRLWSDRISPTHSLIDDACAEHPAILTKVDGHSALVNKRMLDICKITRDTPDPKGGRIERGNDGEPNGILQESFCEFLKPNIPKLTADKLESYLLASMMHLLAKGITSCRSFGSIEDFVTLANMERKGILPMRVCGCIPVESLPWAIDLGAKTGTGNSMFWTGQVKLFADGSLGSKTALVSEPYSDGTYGLEVTSLEDMKHIIDQAHRIGLGVAIHAIGDIAVKNAVLAINEPKGLDTIEHFQCAKPQTIATLRSKGISVVVNPAHIPLDVDAIKKEWKKLESVSYPLFSLTETGVPVGFGSDTPVVDANPLTAVACATLRKGENTEEINLKESIKFHEAMKIAMLDSAKLIGGPKRGSIEPGFAADLAIFSQDFRGREPHEAAKMPVIASYVGGVKVWPK